MNRKYHLPSSPWRNGKKASKSVIVAMVCLGIFGCQKESPTPQAAAPVCIDLSKYCDASLSDSLNSPAQVTENNFANLPKGRQLFAGVPFDVQGVVQLSGKKIVEWGRTEYPEAVNDIKVGKAAKRLHLLHGAGGVYDREGTTIAKVLLHYADGSKGELEIKIGEHVRDWWGDPNQGVTAVNSELAWQGTNPALKKYGGNKPGSLRVYKTTFENPQPDRDIASLDYVSTMQNSSPFMLGLTTE